MPRDSLPLPGSAVIRPPQFRNSIRRKVYSCSGMTRPVSPRAMKCWLTTTSKMLRNRHHWAWTQPEILSSHGRALIRMEARGASTRGNSWRIRHRCKPMNSWSTKRLTSCRGWPEWVYVQTAALSSRGKAHHWPLMTAAARIFTAASTLRTEPRMATKTWSTPGRAVRRFLRWSRARRQETTESSGWARDSATLTGFMAVCTT